MKAACGEGRGCSPRFLPPAGLGGDGDALGAEMPMGTGRAAAGGAESGGWKEMPAGCGPAAPCPVAKSRPGAGGRFGPLLCHHLILPVVSLVPPQGLCPGLGLIPHAVAWDVNPYLRPTPCSPQLQVGKWAQSILWDWDQHTGPWVGTDTLRGGTH